MTRPPVVARRASAAVGDGWPAPVPPPPAMSAVVFREFGPPGVLCQETLPTPVPAPDEVLVQVAAVSVGRLLDLAARAGRHPFAGFVFPHVLGAEHAGVVAVAGRDAASWSPGERVACFPAVADGTCDFCRRGYDELCSSLELIGTHRPGAYAQYVAVPARNLRRVPAGIGPAAAAALALSGPVAMNQLTRAGFRPGQWVLVQGASSALGSLTAGLVRHLGGRVVAASRSAAKRQRLSELGCDGVLDPLAADFAAAVRDLTAGQGADLVIDNLGEPRVWAGSLASLATGGTVVSSGAFLGSELPVNLPRLYLRGQRIMGVRTGNAASVRALWAEVDRGFRPVLDLTFELGQAAEAHRYLEDDLSFGRVALVVPPPARCTPPGPGG